MLEWLKKDDTPAEMTDNTIGAGGTSCLAEIYNKRINLKVNEVPSVIGRTGGSADICFYHESVGLEHCRMECSSRQFFITDLGTKQGTTVNGEKLQPGVPHVIDTDDKLIIGKVKFDIIIYYEELAKREREQRAAEEALREPEEKIYTVYAREVNPLEYEESEVVYINCGIEPPKKKGTFTQEISAQLIQESIKAAEEAKQKTAEPQQTEIMLLSSRGDDGGTEQIIVDHFPFKLGRSRVNDYILRIDRVSREHARILKKDTGYFIEDLNSTNGVSVNGIHIPAGEEYGIKEGDSIKISYKTFTVGFLRNNAD